MTKLLVTSDVTFPTEVVFGIRLTSLDEEGVENVLVNLSDERDDELEALLIVGKLV